MPATDFVEKADKGSSTRARHSKRKILKSLTEHLWFEVPNRRGFVNITQTVEEPRAQERSSRGTVPRDAMHITASVFINDNESGLLHDTNLA